MEQSSSFVQHQPFQLYLLLLEFQLALLHHRKDGEKDARTIRREHDCGQIQANGEEPDQFCSYKFFICEQSDCVEKPKKKLKASSRQVGLSVQAQIKVASSSQGWQRDAQLFISTERPEATDKDQKSLNRQERSVISTGDLQQLNTKDMFRRSRNSRRFRRFRTQKSNLAT